MPIFRVRINDTTMVCERASVYVEAPDEEVAVEYVEELHGSGELPDSVEFREYYSENENSEVVPEGECDASVKAEVVVPAGWLA
jgi:hypothetical protein